MQKNKKIDTSLLGHIKIKKMILLFILFFSNNVLLSVAKALVLTPVSTAQPKKAITLQPKKPVTLQPKKPVTKPVVKPKVVAPKVPAKKTDPKTKEYLDKKAKLEKELKAQQDKAKQDQAKAKQQQNLVTTCKDLETKAKTCLANQKKLTTAQFTVCKKVITDYNSKCSKAQSTATQTAASGTAVKPVPTTASSQSVPSELPATCNEKQAFAKLQSCKKTYCDPADPAKQSADDAETCKAIMKKVCAAQNVVGSVERKAQSALESAACKKLAAQEKADTDASAEKKEKSKLDDFIGGLPALVGTAVVFTAVAGAMHLVGKVKNPFKASTAEAASEAEGEAASDAESNVLAEEESAAADALAEEEAAAADALAEEEAQAADEALAEEEADALAEAEAETADEALAEAEAEAADEALSDFSSLRFKNNIKCIKDESEKIYGLKTVTYNYKSDENKTKHYGLIAEEVEKLFPDLVVYDNEGLAQKVKYSELPILLLNEIQKLKKEIDILKSK